ncbi:PREDICTED: uncharacterized protein LOC105150926 [Acromyrmex echinatior]|uniref:uncharacterized protein LOC105150926 n=1 Tax=Acromyrmex echinatior TaxID=103372 RepID=UPI000580C193|nr:PREDICTED: uncharacterized protein LOC105150926 [Acromyrmex echinatior]
MKKKSEKKRETISSERHRLVEELHAPARRNFPRMRVIVRRYDDLWQADVVEMRPYSGFNRGHHYILIDVLSKYAWAISLKSKDGSETANAIAEIKSLKKHVNHYSTYSMLKASVVERFNRTLKNDIWKMFTLNGNYKWIDELPRLVSDYNARKHRTIGMRPAEVIPAKDSWTWYSAIKIEGPAKFKGYTPNWTTEILTIVKVQRNNPVTYLLEDYREKSICWSVLRVRVASRYSSDVYLVEKVLRRKGNKVYVKWLGFDGLHNSWIHKNNVI